MPLNSGNIKFIGNLGKAEVRPLYLTAAAFARALERVPAEWQRQMYIDISFTEHQHLLHAAHKDLKPIYYINGEWMEWEIA